MAVATEPNVFDSEIFRDQLRQIEIAGVHETVMYAGDRNPLLLAEALGDVGQIAIVGYKSQGPAHAMNLRESLAVAGSDTRVVLALRDGSPTIAQAQRDGFTYDNGTLKTPEKAIATSDLFTMLIEDSAMVAEGERYLRLARSGATVMLAHGFYIGHLEANPDQRIRDDINVGMVAPKGMGPSVRRLYEQGSGINASFAVEQGGDDIRDLVLGYSQGIGSPNTFQTTLGMEWRSDIFGERAILLGGVHGIVEAMYQWKKSEGAGDEQAILETVESVVGPISKTISQEGLRGIVERLSSSELEEFAGVYNAAYPEMKTVIEKIYRDVSSGREIAEVVSDNEANTPMSQVDATDMWIAAAKVRDARGDRREDAVKIDPKVAAVYLAAMMAQVDTLHENGHYWSEIVNESIIEAVDSLNPYMEYNGVAFMVDNCSITARRGSRKWFANFQNAILQGVKPVVQGRREVSDKTDYFASFLKHDVHEAFDVLKQFRPEVDISVTG